MERVLKLIKTEDTYKRYIDEMNGIHTIKVYGCDFPDKHRQEFDGERVSYEQISLIRERIAKIDLYEMTDDFLKKQLSDIKSELIGKRLDVPESLQLKEEKLINDYFEVYQELFENIQNFEKDKRNRKDYWIKTNRYIQNFGERINCKMNELIDIRGEIARSVGVENYQDYCNMLNKTTSFQTSDFVNWKENILCHFIPMVEKVYLKNAQKDGMSNIAAWDLDFLERFECNSKIELEDYIPSILECIDLLDKEFAEYVTGLWEEGYIDIKKRNGKVDFGFCVELPFSGKSFVSIYPSDNIFDVFYLVHELGHVYHYYCKRNLPHSAYRNCNNEVNELIAHLFEAVVIFNFFKKEVSILNTYISQLLISIPYNIAIHEFQEKLYSEQYQSLEDKEQLFNTIIKKYTHHCVVTEGFEKELATLWLINEQIFSSPFYYLQYSLAKIATIQYISKQKAIMDLSAIHQVCTKGATIGVEEIFTSLVDSGLLITRQELNDMAVFVEIFLEI